MNVDLKFDSEGFRLAALEWWDSNICHFESQQDAQERMDEWYKNNVARFTEVKV
jgi:hypothetical protein